MMADSYIEALDLVLIDNFPGVPLPLASEYFADGFGASCGCNVAMPTRNPGTKVQIWQTGDNGPRGWSTLVYAKAEEVDATYPILEGHILTVSGETRLETWKLSNDKDDVGAYASGVCAIALGAVTENYYSWFWCGGVPPADQFSGMKTANITTSNAVTQGLALCMGTATEATTGNIFLLPAAAELHHCAVAMKADV